MRARLTRGPDSVLPGCLAFSRECGNCSRRWHETVNSEPSVCYYCKLEPKPLNEAQLAVIREHIEAVRRHEASNGWRNPPCIYAPADELGAQLPMTEPVQ